MEATLNGIAKMAKTDDSVDTDELGGRATEASSFLKALGHEGRLMILCHLSSGEKTVTELEKLLSSRQASVSQQLARLRLEGLVNYRREGKAIYYTLGDTKARQAIDLVYNMFCSVDQEDQPSRSTRR